MRRRLIAVLAVVGLAAAAPSATIVIPAEFREVVNEAGLIVRGRVTDVRAVAVPGGGVDSIATVAIESVLKGQAASGFVSMRVPGGERGRIRHVLVGAPTFKAGQRAVLFLKQGADDAWRPIGLTQGVYRVQAEPQSGRPVVQPPLVGGRTASASGAAVRGDPRRRLMPVAEFESLVRLVLASPPGQAVPRGGRR